MTIVMKHYGINTGPMRATDMLQPHDPLEVQVRDLLIRIEKRLAKIEKLLEKDARLKGASQAGALG
jgi:hypothetical protein